MFLNPFKEFLSLFVKAKKSKQEGISPKSKQSKDYSTVGDNSIA